MDPAEIATVEAERAAQGLPPRITDPVALARVAELLLAAPRAEAVAA